MTHLIKSKFGLSLLLLGVCVVVTSIFALDTWNTGYKNLNMTAKAVRVGGNTAQTCYRSYNASGKDAFIPTKTGGQYNSVNNHPNMRTGCYRNLAIGRYSATNSYNYPEVNHGQCKRYAPTGWKGLTDGVINGNKQLECASWPGRAVWASSSHHRTHNLKVSLDLNGQFIANKVRVWDERGPYMAESGATVAETNANTALVYAYVKDATSAGSCYAASSGWELVGSHTFGKYSAGYYDYDFPNKQIRCVMLLFPRGNNHGGWKTQNGYSNAYVFLRELQVFGF